MENYFAKVKEYLLELEYEISKENAEDQVLIIENEDNGIKNLVVGCADTVLIMEQFILELKAPSAETYCRLLQFNREVVHGCFAIDETGKKVIFRDTHELENLDLNELEASLNSLGMVLTEHLDDLIAFAK